MKEQVKVIADYIAGGISLGAAIQVVHILLAIPAAVYMCIRIYEWHKSKQEKK